MRFSFEQLQMFVTVVEAGSFSAAAQRLKKAQSTVSGAIAGLEIDLAVELFLRTGRTPIPTPAGHALYGKAVAILERCLLLESHADGLAEGHPSELNLAIEIPYNMVIPVLKEFDRQYPYVDLTVRHPVYGDVSELVLQGEVALGIAFSQSNYPPGLGFIRLGSLIMTHVVHPAHPLAALSTVSFAELNLHRRLAFSAHANKLPTAEYLHAPQTWCAENYLAILELAKAGIGWATLPKQLVQESLNQGALVEIPLMAYPHTDWHVGVDLLWAKQKRLNIVEQWLKETFQRHPIWDNNLPALPTI